MEQNKTSGFHHLLYFAKWFVLIFAAIDLITLFTHDLTQARIADQCFAACKIILLAGMKEDPKKLAERMTAAMPEELKKHIPV